MIDLGWLRTADMHSVTEKMRLSKPTTKISMTVDPYYRQQKCWPMILVSGGVRFMRIFAEVPWGRQTTVGLSTTAIFCIFAGDFFGNFRDKECYYMAIRSPLSAFQWSQNAWPWMNLNGYFALNSVFAPVWLDPTARLSKNNCVKTNKDRHILPAAQIFDRDSSFWHYKVCADIRSGFIERRH